MDGLAEASTEFDVLLAAAQAGDDSALGQLVDRYRPYLKSIAARLLGDRLAGKLDASDVVQEGLMAAVQQFPQFRGQGAAAWQAWLVAIVRNEAINRRRYWGQDLRDVGREQPLPEGSSSGLQLAGDSSTPSEVAARRERAARLMAALDRLPPEVRQVIELRNFERLPYREIAARLGRSEPATRQLWVRAIRQLRELLREDR